MEYVVVDARGLPVGVGEEAIIFAPGVCTDTGTDTTTTLVREERAKYVLCR